MLPLVRPMPLVLLPAAFNHPAFVWELKHDGFRGLAYVERGRCRLFSRAGREFRQFAELAAAIGRAVGRRRSVVLDGEIAVLGSDGRSQFRPLLARRGVARFLAFDLLWVDGVDWRGRALLDRKARLRELLPGDAGRLLYVEHVEGGGAAFHRAACGLDVEGVIGKYAGGVYQCGASASSWVKVLNPAYSQRAGRRELFEARRGAGRRIVGPRPRLVLA